VNRKVLALSVSSVIAAVVLSAAGYHFFMQPNQPQTEAPPVAEKPKFHPFEVEYHGPTLSFYLQNLGNVSATNITVTITARWNPTAQDKSQYPIGTDGKPLDSMVYQALIPKMEAKEVNEYQATFQTPFNLISSQTSGLQWFDFSISCAEGVNEAITIPA